MTVLKLIHVLSAFIWVGNLLCLTRLMGYHVREDQATQVNLARLYKRMYFFISLPMMFLTVILGAVLLLNFQNGVSMGWFHMKLTFAMGLIVCDFFCGRHVLRLNRETEQGKGVKFKILHGVTGLALIGVLTSGIVVRDKEGEIRYRIAMERQEESFGQTNILSKIDSGRYDLPH